MKHLAEKLVLGNWKMHMLRDGAGALAAKIAASPMPQGVDIAVFPPFTSLEAVRQGLAGSGILLGAQDCHSSDEGAFTGSVSASMLRDAGCAMVIVGHSERRHLLGETSATVREKAAAALRQGLHTVLCVGETLAEREHGSYLAAVGAQLRESLPHGAERGALTIAYEPVWAIGTGKNAALSDITEMHGHLARILSEITGGAAPRILYGGSVKANNALDILSLPVVDGVLVGGASLDADAFISIAAAAGTLSSHPALQG